MMQHKFGVLLLLLSILFRSQTTQAQLSGNSSYASPHPNQSISTSAVCQLLNEDAFTKFCESSSLHYEYDATRSAVIALGQEAVPFLNTPSEYDGWREKWMKRVLLARIQRPQTYSDLEAALKKEYDLMSRAR